jgi:hypothetical protein
LSWSNRVHRLCRRKTWPVFSAEISTITIHNRTSLACGKPVRHGDWLGPFPHIPNEPGRLGQRRLHATTGSLAERLRVVGPLRYPSRVCSISGDAIDRIAEAIDQLASDAQGETSGQELATRVADLWRMVSALDPELARRTKQYTAPGDGAPSA